jgi:hypothetical protein
LASIGAFRSSQIGRAGKPLSSFFFSTIHSRKHQPRLSKVSR